MSNNDDLYNLFDDNDDDNDFADPDDEFFSSTKVIGDGGGDRLFLGMTPIERMFISIFLFMNVAVLGIALLLATGRIG